MPTYLRVRCHGAGAMSRPRAGAVEARPIGPDRRSAWRVVGIYRRHNVVTLGPDQLLAAPASSSPVRPDCKAARNRAIGHMVLSVVHVDRTSKHPRNGLNWFHTRAEAGDVFAVLLECTVRQIFDAQFRNA